MNPPLGVLKRKIKTKEQRQAELEAQIRKKQVSVILLVRYCAYSELSNLNDKRQGIYSLDTASGVRV